jgi:hypothetical protein
MDEISTAGRVNLLRTTDDQHAIRGPSADAAEVSSVTKIRLHPLQDDIWTELLQLAHPVLCHKLPARMSF